jgi:hypothetical protein
MKNTVELAITSRQIADPKGAVEWINREAMPFLAQARAAANQEYNAAFEVRTAATGTFTSIWTSDSIQTNRALLVEARIVGRATVAGRAAYILRGLFSNEAGVVAQQGTTQVDYSEESVAGFDARFLVSGQTIALQVRDDGLLTVDWLALVKVLTTKEL